MKHIYYHLTIANIQKVAERRLANLDNNAGLANAKQRGVADPVMIKGPKATAPRKTVKGKFITQHK